MWHRLKQFWSNFRAELSSEDHALVILHLSPAELDLFNMMNTATRKHSINVARTVVNKVGNSFDSHSLEILVKAALLHDIGKSAANLNVLYKSLYVLIKKLFPGLLQGLPKRANRRGLCGILTQALYIAENHARIGASLAEEHGIDPVLVKIIAAHHDEPTNPISRIIWEADNSN